jgi:VWFA-related protein
MSRIHYRFFTLAIAAIFVLFAGAAFLRASAHQQSQSQQQQQTAPPSLRKPTDPQPAQSQPPPTAPQAAPQQTQTPQQSATPGQIRVTSPLVVVPVTVKNGSGALVNNLLQEDFRVFEDGVEQRISLFALDPYPMSAVVLLDNALGERNSDQVHKSLRAIAGGFAAGDEVTVMRFDHYTEDFSGFINDPDKLLTQLGHIALPGEFDAPAGGPMTLSPMINGQPAPGAPGVTQKRAGPPSAKCINDAVYAAAALLRPLPRNRRKIIFLVSDGLNSKGNTHNFPDTIKMLESSEVSVYSIGVGGAFLDRGVSIISRLAHESGGDVFYVGRESTLESLYARVADQARNQYTIGYAPPEKGRMASYHSVEVRVRRGGLTVQARRGYFAATRQTN